MLFSPPAHNELLRHYYRSLLESLSPFPPLEKVSLLPIDADSFQPYVTDDCSAVNIGVYLPENGLITSACLKPLFPWDVIVVPSSWLKYQLNIRGLNNVVTVAPGFTLPTTGITFGRPRDNRFIVASSGRVTLHGGHDLLLAAMKKFMALHNDCWFACNWSFARRDMDELKSSPYCDLAGCSPWDHSGFMEHNGIDCARIMESRFDSAENAAWDVVADADVYLSSARVDLGADAIIAAFRTAGKPVITFEARDCTPLPSPDGTTVWFEPAIADIVERLESQYELWCQGQTAKTIELRSWKMAADELYHLVFDCYTRHFSNDKPLVTAFTWNKRGVALAGLGLYDAALNNYRHALALEPLNPETYNCIGNLMDTQERFPEAVLYFEKAINLDKLFVAAFFNKATTLKQMHLLDEAIDTYQKALQIDPQFTMGWLNLAIAFALDNQEDKADECFRKTLELAPDNTDALFLWGNQLLCQQELEMAIDCYEKVLVLEPDHYLACNSMGIAWLSLMEAEKAFSILQRALLYKPDMTSCMTNIGTACRDLGRLDEAVLWYNRAVAIEPDNADTHWNLALALLHQGNYEMGWREYEWRFQKSDKIIIPSCDALLWSGENLKGKRILLQAEQGYGDTIQFIRYAQLVSSQGACVIAQCQDANIRSVVRLLPGVDKIITWNDKHPPVDFKIPLMSLPLAFQTTPDTIPFAGGYIVPADNDIAYWHSIIDSYTTPGKVRVGFVWDGRKTFRNDKRSIPIEKLTPVFELEEIACISLQKGAQAQPLISLAASCNMIDLTDQLDTFADTAALIAGLDLVICVDTSVAHLAAAVGCPTWVMLKLGSDWRWLEKRSDCPWYATARLYRQENDGCWDAVIKRLIADLIIFVAHKKLPKVPCNSTDYNL